jgi:hypothetical protein
MTNGTGLLAILLGALALIIAVGVFASFASVRRRLILLQGKAGQADILQAVARQVEEVRALRGEIRSLAEQLAALGEAFQGTLQRVSVFRYDAFEDMGGKLSFSAAILDARGTGMVVSCINGRQEARTYAKPIEQGRSLYNLSPEEIEAIRLAIAGKVTG